MDGYLSKPFSISDIENLILQHLAAGASDSDKLVEVTGMQYRNSQDSTQSETESQVLNLAAIESIREIERKTGKQLLPSIFEGYVHQMDEKLRDIKREILAEDCTSVYRTAHAIKSMSANIGANRVRNISSHIEKKGREKELAGLADSVIVLTEAYHQFVDEFDICFAK